MKVEDVMRTCPQSCGAATDLSAASGMLWCRACGALPVVDASGKVIGIITDRDICVATGVKNRRPSEVTAEEIMSRPVVTCRTGDEIHAALETMRTWRVRRLPVVNDAGKLEGMLCLSDLILQSRHDDGSHPGLCSEDVMGVLKAIYWRHTVSCGCGLRAAS